MDGPPAQSLGVEPVDPDVMTRPPRKRNAPVLTWPLISRVLTSATIIMLGTMAVYTHEMLTDGEVNKRDTTMTFTCFVLFDMFNALNCRSEGKSILRGGWPFQQHLIQLGGKPESWGADSCYLFPMAAGRVSNGGVRIFRLGCLGYVGVHGVLGR